MEMRSDHFKGVPVRMDINSIYVCSVSAVWVPHSLAMLVWNPHWVGDACSGTSGVAVPVLELVW